MFNIGDKLTKENYTQGAIWCNANNAKIEVIDGEYVIVAVPEPTAKETAETRITELKQLLANTDYIIIKLAEDAASREEYAEQLEQRKAWRKEINELEEILNPVEEIKANNPYPAELIEEIEELEEKGEAPRQ